MSAVSAAATKHHSQPACSTSAPPIAVAARSRRASRSPARRCEASEGAPSGPMRFERDRTCAIRTGCEQASASDVVASYTGFRSISEIGPERPQLNPAKPLHCSEELRDLQEVRVGETGFEPATARPPAGAIQAYPVRFGWLERV